MAIDALDKKRARVRSVDLAGSLGVARASVCKALDRLSENGYAVRGEGGNVRLTAKGKEAVGIYSPARDLLKGALTEKLGLGEARAEKEALAALGAMSTDTVQRIARLYGGAEERDKNAVGIRTCQRASESCKDAR